MATIMSAIPINPNTSGISPKRKMLNTVAAIGSTMERADTVVAGSDFIESE